MQPGILLTALLVSKRYLDSSLLINPIRFSTKKQKLLVDFMWMRK